MELVPAQIVLSTGESFSGQAPISQKEHCFGEIVFNTGMVGYVESLTDPSYTGQILVFTYPLIGNYGVPDPATWESSAIHVKGVVMSELAAHYSNHSAQHSLLSWLNEQKIPFIVGVDTRALTIQLREHGVIPGAISLGTTKPVQFEDFSRN